MSTVSDPTGTTTGTRFATSADGTQIAYEARGTGAALVIVEGALCHRTMGVSTALADALEDRFTVFSYDRRGRGESGAGATPWSLEREVEDLEAVIDAAGGHAHVFRAPRGRVKVAPTSSCRSCGAFGVGFRLVVCSGTLTRLHPDDISSRRPRCAGGFLVSPRYTNAATTPPPRGTASLLAFDTS
jgi:hypothetical protein